MAQPHISTLEIFSNNRLNKFLGILRDEIKHLLRNLSRNSCHRFAKVKLQSMLLEMTFNNIMRMVAGKWYYRYSEDVKDEEEARKFRQIIKELTRFGGASNPAEFVPILQWMDYGGLEKKLKSLSKRTDEFLQALIDEKRLKEEEGNTMIDHMLSLQKSQREYYTDQIIKGLILVLLLAGTDTSAVTLEWAMTNLLNHPNILKKARDEINSQIGEEKLIEESDVSKLHYLQSIISETLRLYPAAPLLVPHMSSTDYTMIDPVVWDDATSFKPERFENGESEGQKLMPFGIGRRTCPGVGLAQRTVSLTLGSLIQCFEWERVTTEEVDIDEGSGITIPKAMPLGAMFTISP
ncbi:hypothetical protein ACB092_09G162000 [Castanea dentata]